MQSANTWINFRELRLKLKFVEVLTYYKIDLKRKGDRATGFCPLTTHRGKRNSPSFSVNLERNIWQCFGCRAKGNVLDFVCRMEGLNPDDPQDFRKGALRGRDLFLSGLSRAPLEVPPPTSPPAPPTRDSGSKIINAPIDFELQTLDYDHPYLQERGFTDETIQHFGLGFCNRGMLKGRIAIPLHDLEGRLVGYAGRLTKDKMISAKHPKYLFPGSRERNGVTLEFRKSLLLYNAHLVQKPVDDLIVVEGFPACWWLWQAGHVNTVALMGASCSQEQAKLIVELVSLNGKVWAMPDGNEAGISCATNVIDWVVPHRFTRWIRLDATKQPTDYSVDELARLFAE